MSADNASSVKRGLPEDCSFTWRTRGDGGGLKSWDHQCTCWHRVSLIAVVHRCHCGAVKAEEKGKR